MLYRRILLELDPTDDPVWIFFDTQHKHILQLLRTACETSTSRIEAAIQRVSEDSLDERKVANDLRICVASLELLDGESVRGLLNKNGVNNIILTYCIFHRIRSWS